MSEPTPNRSWRVRDVHLALDEPESVLRERACETAGIAPEACRGLRIARRSLDARRTSGGRRFRHVLHVDLIVASDYSSASFEQACRTGRVVETPPPGRLEVPASKTIAPGSRVAVIGAGPAGLFAALVLGRSGYRVDLIERGGAIPSRGRAMASFFKTRVPDPENNLLFGEGGAGTYSDGKLYTRVDHALAQVILEELVACGAPPDICYDARAHIGTDRLHRVLPALRDALEAAGVRFHWHTRAEGIVAEGAGLRRVRAIAVDGGEIACDAAMIALGHSARDTYVRLIDQGVVIEARASQIGVRIEHPQGLIDTGRYGDGPEAAQLGPSYYALVNRAGKTGAGGYSFCMCPGGQIVASVNEAGFLCTNGMSNSKHSSGWANAAIVTPVGPREYGPGALAGIDFQRRLESAFFEAGGKDYTAPAQRADDFVAGRASTDDLRTSYKFGVRSERIDQLLPETIRDALARAITNFDRKLPGFAGREGVLVGIETRCSAPLRMPRDRESFRAAGFANLYPVGEGAGFAGGILSAAIDGARAAQALLTTPED